MAPSENTALLSDDSIQQYQGLAARRPSRGAHSNYSSTVQATEDLDKDVLNQTTWKDEITVLFRYSLPLVLTYLLQFSYSMILIYVAGRLGTAELGAASIATMTANITGIVLFESMASCLDTLTSQAYGSGKKELVGLHVQRAIVLILLLTIPVAVIWLCSPLILVPILPDKEVALMAGAFLRVFVIGAPGYAIFESLKRLSQAQGNFVAPMVVALLCAPLNIFFNWLFVFHFDLGFEGAALAIGLSYDLQPILFVLYINFFAPYLLECWPAVSYRAILQNWGPMIRLAIPSVIMVWSEMMAFEILTFSSSYLSSTHLAAQSVLMSIGVFLYHIPFPMSVAASTRFGNMIGAGALDAARVAFRVFYCVILVIGALDLILLSSLRYFIAKLFTEDEAVRELIVATVPIMAAMQMVDATTAMSNGLLRGLGRQRIGGWVNVCAYYVFAVPLSILLAFGPPHLDLLGLWIGPTIGLSIVTVVISIYLRTTDWKKAVIEAQSRH